MAKFIEIIAQQKRNIEINRPKEVRLYHDQVDRLKNVHNELDRLQDIRRIIEQKIQELNSELYAKEQRFSSMRRESEPINQGIYMLDAVKHELSQLIRETYADLERRELLLLKKIRELEEHNAELKNELKKSSQQRSQFFTEFSTDHPITKNEPSADSERIDRIEQKVDSLTTQVSRLLKVFDDPVLNSYK